jgi:hypothetical protein
VSTRSRIYLLLCIVGFVIPNFLLIGYIRDNGWHLSLDQVITLFATNKLALAVLADVVLASVAFFYWMFREARKHDIKAPWAFVLFAIFFGLSFSLPLFLFVRQSRRDALNPKV